MRQELHIAFNAGFQSYPNSRLLYPDAPGEEENAWLAGWNSAASNSNEDIEELGFGATDTYLWDYKTG